MLEFVIVCDVRMCDGVMLECVMVCDVRMSDGV